ncbi:hypothetical protein F475_04657 [Pseudomonas sp. URMO17WK12:I6]|jgi:hypothetical protein|uniref:DUF6367 family protein n=1 Tax=Pseudomonas sp. URMO17WK12:I6 TaxID=1261629 RepID=UPI000DABC7DD|nr:DUF6367 family protein [Pseudomonas sp. URMO17WK12:I6]PZW56021.1 hypothetical protein F475_04657 [Pseudomonas sp. URMO17WK12:I6]
MKLQDILGNDSLEEIEDVSVFLPTELLRQSGIALESYWQQDSSGWSYRVDPENPNIPLQRHVHIAKTKHTQSKDLQVSWNVDGSRHDKKSFNASLGAQHFPQELARRVLNLADSVVLEDFGSKEIRILSDEATFSTDGKEAFVRFSLSLS